VAGDVDADDGYVSPDFDLPSHDGSDEDEVDRRPAKKAKRSDARTLEDDESLAAALLAQ